jgi:type II secretory pathway component PulK
LSRARDEHGVVLLLVLSVIVLTVSSVYAFAHTSLLHMMASVHRMDRTRADLAARTGVDIALRAVLDDGSNGGGRPEHAIETALDSWHQLGGQTLELPDEGTLQISVRDAGQRINLNALIDAEGEPHEESRAFLIAALERIVDYMPGRSEDKPYKIEDLADGILDWIDANDTTRLGDDEADFYRGQGAQPPPDRPLWLLAELAALPDVDDALLRGLEPYFTTQPFYPRLSESGVNPNTAPAHVLSLIYRGSPGDKQLLDEDAIFSILRARQEGRIFCPTAGEEPCVSFESEIGRVGETVFPPLGYVGQVFAVRSVAAFGEARACIETTIDRREPSEPKTLTYRTDC